MPKKIKIPLIILLVVFTGFTFANKIKKDIVYLLKKKHIDEAIMYIDSEININYRDKNGTFPIFYALHLNNYELMEKMLSKSNIEEPKTGSRKRGQRTIVSNIIITIF